MFTSVKIWLYYKTRRWAWCANTGTIRSCMCCSSNWSHTTFRSFKVYPKRTFLKFFSGEWWEKKIKHPSTEACFCSRTSQTCIHDSDAQSRGINKAEQRFDFVFRSGHRWSRSNIYLVSFSPENFTWKSPAWLKFQGLENGGKTTPLNKLWYKQGDFSWNDPLICCK